MHGGAIEAIVLQLSGVREAAEVARDEIARGAMAHGAEVGVRVRTRVRARARARARARVRPRVRVPEVGQARVEACAAHDDARAEVPAAAARVGVALCSESGAGGGDGGGELRLGVEVEGGVRGVLEVAAVETIAQVEGAWRVRRREAAYVARGPMVARGYEGGAKAAAVVRAVAEEQSAQEHEDAACARAARRAHAEEQRRWAGDDEGKCWRELLTVEREAQREAQGRGARPCTERGRGALDLLRVGVRVRGRLGLGLRKGRHPGRPAGRAGRGRCPRVAASSERRAPG
eukprot:scaffold58735_cov60-Phaeocystis_antarctica.AAC.3